MEQVAAHLLAVVGEHQTEDAEAPEVRIQLQGLVTLGGIRR